MQHVPEVYLAYPVADLNLNDDGTFALRLQACGDTYLDLLDRSVFVKYERRIFESHVGGAPRVNQAHSGVTRRVSVVTVGSETDWN